MNIRPPYSVVAALSGRMVSRAEAGLTIAVDKLMRSVRICEFVESDITPEERNAILQKHIEAAFEYYSTFSPEDMAKMLIADEIFDQIMEKEGGKKNE